MQLKVTYSPISLETTPIQMEYRLTFSTDEDKIIYKVSKQEKIFIKSLQVIRKEINKVAVQYQKDLLEYINNLLKDYENKKVQ